MVSPELDWVEFIYLTPSPINHYTYYSHSLYFKLTSKHIPTIRSLSHTHTPSSTVICSFQKMTSAYITIYLYGNICVPFSFSSLVGLTDTSASTQSGSQTKLFLRMDHYTRAAWGICENAIQVSLPLGNLSRLQEFIFSAASLENDILTPFTWKSLCLFICNSGLCVDLSEG